MIKKRYITKENAYEIGILGGRPKGSLNPNTILAIRTKEAMIKEIEKQTGRIVNNLLLGSDKQDTSASKELLDRAFGKSIQAINLQAVTFSLKDLAEYREKLKNPPIIDVEITKSP